MNVVLESRDFIKENGGHILAKKHALELYDNDNFRKYELYPMRLRTGNMYAFKYYDYAMPLQLHKRKIPYGDLHPFGILLEVNDVERKLKLLNLNVVPPRVRDRLFMTIFKFFHSLIGTNMRSTNFIKWRKIPITEEFIKKNIPFDFGMAINTFDMKKIKKIYALDWSNSHALISLYFEKKLFYNRLDRITKHTVYKSFFTKPSIKEINKLK